MIKKLKKGGCMDTPNNKTLDEIINELPELKEADFMWMDGEKERRIRKYKKYIKYIGSYAKRFYNPFEKKYIFKITGFKFDNIESNYECDIAFFKINDGEKSWYWDVDDCTIITNKISLRKGVASIHHPKYKKHFYNPYSDDKDNKKIV